ncbi:MAG TPA: efflux RND transporter periplasmic adaptor subunit [Gemmatimonadaceae bacterium]|nr:efflux RND transporter periplasmic adaptor subunit [Gemmatimonadaceae bacterium]
MTSRAGLIGRVALVVAVLGGASWAAYWFTRPEATSSNTTTPPAMDHSAHGGMAAGSGDSGQMVALSGEVIQRLGVTFVAAARGPIADTVRAVAVVEYDQTRVKTVSAKVDGWVEQLDVAFAGQAVTQGAPLLRLYSPMIVTAQEELLLAKRLASEVGTVGDGMRNAQELLASARRRLQYYDVPVDVIARIERTGEIERTMMLRSPTSGVVVRLGVRVGQKLMSGEPAYELADLGEVWLEGDVFERDLAAVQVGQSVVAEFAALRGETRRGRIVFIDPTVSAETRTARVRIALANPGQSLKPGMYATLRLAGVARNVLHIPRSAVLVTGQRTIVFVRDEMQMYVAREIAIGQATADRVEVLRGLKAGEVVVASATFLIDAESNLGAAGGAMSGMKMLGDTAIKR